MANHQGIILLVLFSLISVKVQANVFDTICSDTIDPAFCLSTLRSDPRTASADLPGLALISIDLAQAKAATTLTWLGSLSKGATDPVLRQRYDECATYYSASSRDLTKAAQAVNSGSYVEVSSYAATAIVNAASCDDDFEAPPLRASNTDMVNLCSILLSVALEL